MPDRNAIPRIPEPHAEPGWKLRLEAKLGLLDRIQILVFRSFGTPDLLRLRGRVVEHKGTSGSTEESSLWQNVVDMLHRLESDEIPGARIRARLQGREWETTSDREGYFILDLDPPEPLAPGWHDVELELVDSIGEPERRRFTEPVLVPSPDAELAVVSDLDDTIIETHSTAFLQQMAILFGESARDRVPFPGVPAFYRALSRGADDEGQNPIFYVSRSGWNLSDLFEEFMEVNGIPPGPLFLSDLRLVEHRSSVLGSSDDKFSSIDLLIRTYTELPFILIGDSGMCDPELYRQLVQAHPGRIAAIYIHDVSPPERDDELAELAGELEGQGVSLLRMESTLTAAEHARERGYISEQGLAEVRQEVERQEAESRDVKEER